MTATEVISSTNDGQITKSGASWSIVHDATSGGSPSTSNTSLSWAAGAESGGTYYCERSFFIFDTSALSGTVHAAYFEFVPSYSGNLSKVCIQEATCGSTLATSDFDQFTGTSLGEATPGGANERTRIWLNDVSCVNTSGLTKLVMRNYDYDYLDVDPNPSAYGTSCYYADDGSAWARPKLVVITGSETEPLKEDLVAYYNLDTNGTVDDATGTQSDATIEGGASYDSSGVINGDYTFDGTGDQIDTGVDLGSRDYYSVSFWANSDGASGRNRAPVGQYDGDSLLRVFFNQPDDIRVDAWGTGGSLAQIVDSYWTLGTYYHVVVVFHKGDVELYVDGDYVAYDNATYGSSNTGSGSFHIGDYGTGTYKFIGDVDEVGLWNRPLSPDEINRLYNSGSGLAYPFSEEEPTSEANALLHGVNA